MAFQRPHKPPLDYAYPNSGVTLSACLGTYRSQHYVSATIYRFRRTGCRSCT